MEKIVVGVDGSEGSRAALRWAWAEATAWRCSCRRCLKLR